MAGKPVKIGHSPRYCDCRMLVPMPFFAATAEEKANRVVSCISQETWISGYKRIDTFGKKVMMISIHQILKSPTLT